MTVPTIKLAKGRQKRRGEEGAAKKGGGGREGEREEGEKHGEVTYCPA